MMEANCYGPVRDSYSSLSYKFRKARQTENKEEEVKPSTHSSNRRLIYQRTNKSVCDSRPPSQLTSPRPA